ncbi:MAG: hypothetical protein IKM97_04955 [Clostridia bacterium]|nr:hypothetical protein [Clostridia bacterium]
MENIEISEKDNKLLELIEKLVAEGVARGIKLGLEQNENEKRLKEKITYDIKLKNTRLLLKNYRKFVNFCKQATFSEKELESATVEELLDKIYCSAYDEVTIVQGILSSKKRTEIIMTHIKKIINFYIFDANDSKNDEKCRRANILNDLYIKDKKQPAMSVLAKKYHISERQVHRDKNIAIEEVAVMMFGVDGIRKM